MLESARLSRALRRGGPVVLVVTIVVLAVAAVFTALQQPVYSATSKVFVSTGAASSITDLNQSSAFTQQVVKSYVDVATTPYVLTPVIRQLGLSTTPAQLANRVTASAPIGTVVIEITATSATPSTAASVANAVSQRLGAAVVNLSPATTSAASASVTITPLQSAVASPRPTSPNVLLNLLLGAIAGIVLGIIVVLVRDRLDTRIRDLDDIVRATGASVVGTIALPAMDKDRGIVIDRLSGPEGEAFRTVKAHLALLDDSDTLMSVVVTAADREEGSSYVAANLAASLASSDRRVLLVEADLRSPRLASTLGLPEGPGLSDVLTGAARLPAAIRRTEPAGLEVLPAGAAEASAGELLQTRAMPELMNRLAQSFDVVVYDTPDLNTAIDAGVIAKHATGVLFVCGVDQADVVEVADAVAELEQLGAHLAGVVATTTRSGRGRRSAGGLGRRTQRGIAVGGGSISAVATD